MKRWVLTAGDPLGLGSGLIAKSWLAIPNKLKKNIVICGSSYVLEKAFKKAKIAFPKNQIINVSDKKNINNDTAAEITADSLLKAVELVKDDRALALITAPVNKERLQKVWRSFTGQTEWLASQIGGNPAMVFCVPNHGKLKFPTIILATTHLKISDVPKSLSKQIIIDKINILKNHLRDQGIKKPKIAVLGLNPHAGENGKIGNEEIKIINPAINDINSKFVSVEGTFPADSFFCGTHKKYDGVLAMYHDQGLIPAKMAWGLKAVNVTLGLPVIRTSPGHGTAEGLKFNEIDPAGMLSAIKVAVRLAQSG